VSDAPTGLFTVCSGRHDRTQIDDPKLKFGGAESYRPICHFPRLCAFEMFALHAAYGGKTRAIAYHTSKYRGCGVKTP